MRKTALFLCAVLCLGLFAALPTSAALSANAVAFEDGEDTLLLNQNAADILINGGFEFGTDTDQSAWSITGCETIDGVRQNFFGGHNIKRISGGHSGSYAVQLTNTLGSTSKTALIQSVSLTPGVTYELSTWIKSLNASSGYAYFHGMFLDASGSNAPFSRIGQTYQNPTATTPITLPENTWTRKCLRFTAPEGAVQLTFYLYLEGIGSVLLDDVLVLAPKDAIPAPAVSEKKQPILTENSSDFGKVYEISQNFERYADGHFIGKSDRPGGHNIMVSDDYNHTEGGSKGLWMKNYINSDHNDFEPNLYNLADLKLVPGATYQISTWILAPEPGTSADFSYWIDFTLSDKSTDQKKVHYNVRNYAWWREFTFDFTVPVDSASVTTTIELRMANKTMQYYIDDVSLYMIEKPPYAEIETDEMFYYTEWPTGVCSTTENVAFANTLSGGRVEYTFLDQDQKTVLASEVVSVSGGKAEYVFETSLIAEKGKKYFIAAKVYNASGVVLQEEICGVYRFDRPTYLGADGVFRKNGKEYNIMYGSNVTNDLLDADPRRGGVTIVKIISDYSNLSLIQKMDKAHQMGLLCVVGLYGNSKINSTESIITTVNSVKDHPALYGYQVHDEPYQKGCPESELERAYVTIRTLDPNHVVNLVDSVQGGFDYIFRYADQVDIDYYGGANVDSGRKTYEIMSKANEASKGRKPFTLMQQAFQYEQYLPTIDEMRNMTYQAFFAGAQGISYHALGIDGSDGVTTPYMFLDDWQELCERFAPWEQGFLLDCFVNNKYQLLKSYQDNNIMWRTYYGDGKVYVIAFNRQKDAASSATVPIVYADGTSVFGEYIATRKAGTKDTTAPSISGSGTLTLTLGGIVGREKGMTLKSLGGLAAEIWEVASLNTITRGTFAEDLVKTLGLTALTNSNFADVDSAEEYADEIAIGKALGIFTSTNNNFSPEAELSHQDMMTWIMRGVRVKTAQLAGENINVSSVSTQELVSAWPTLEAAATLRSSLIRGAADGTISSTGAATRYETAAILEKLAAWVNAPGEEVPLQKSAGDLSVALREKMYNGFLSGTWSKADVNHANFMAHTFTFDSKNFTLFVNGGNETTSISKSYFNVGMQVYALSEGNADASYTVASGGTTGTLSLTLPRDGVALFERLKALPTDGLFKDQLVLLHLKNGAVLKMTNGAHAVLFKKNGNTLEMVEGLDNNSTLSLPDGDCVVKVFYWSAPLVATQSALTFEKQ